MADLKISELPVLTGALLAATDPVPIVDLSASETKRLSAKDFVQFGIQLIDDNSIPAGKLDGTLPAGSVGTLELADGAVTAAKLADQSSGVYNSLLPAAGAFVGQIAVNSSDEKAYIWTGATWQPFRAGGSINTLTYDNSVGPVDINGVPSGDSVSLSVRLEDTTAGARFLAGPALTGGAVNYRAIVGSDLPTAGTVKGAVAVTGGGLAMNGDAITIDNAIAPSASDFHLVTYDEHGLISGGRLITGADLPPATDADRGVVRPGPDLKVDAGGILTHTNVIPAGIGVKTSFDGNGHITGTLALEADDLPSIPADKITGGSGLDVPAVIPDRSIAEIKLADYSTCLVQEGAPSGDYKLGQLWFTPSTSQLRVYGRGSSGDLWLSVGFGALQAQNLRWAGTVNADTANITTLTDIGVSEGLTAGSPIPTPSDELSGLYFVVDTAGSSITIPNVNGELCTEGDWILYVDQAQGAIHLDISAGGGGGGGGASKLNDLTDVDLNTVEDEQFLRYDSISGLWKNVGEIDGGSF